MKPFITNRRKNHDNNATIYIYYYVEISIFGLLPLDAQIVGISERCRWTIVCCCCCSNQSIGPLHPPALETPLQGRTHGRGRNVKVLKLLCIDCGIASILPANRFSAWPGSECDETQLKGEWESRVIFG